MIKLFLTLLVATLPVLENETAIDWSATRKLTWDDFKGRPDPNLPNAALTNSTINLDYAFTSLEMAFRIRCQFNTDRSWVKTKSEAVLAHEQGHFDITELHARKLNKALQGEKIKDNSVTDQVNALQDKIKVEHHAMQRAYDQETDFSRNAEQQAKWAAKIAAELKAMEKYSDYKGEKKRVFKK
ncbi:MAG: DUF922 domain-containing protein [Candidatus Pseudobacter hemicellulosilyticus]|uniref:DUF922 domain-containing protein n=1 Tax=Candidatus Pseudobacter hemicellulosilyticus TaxID=3121375 RepID=A0AAJ5WUZ9_9BACT|nr:MAG: DUF922 domain-containing protein [Pseudobacter sp.]